MDEILSKLNDFDWLYADKDPKALAILEERIAKASAHENRTIRYSDLVRGVEFNLPGGSVYEITNFQNYGFDSRLIGDYLGYICKRSYERACFMASAAVVMKDEGIPSPPFFGFMTKLGLLKSPNDDKATEVWIKELDKAHQHYKSD